MEEAEKQGPGLRCQQLWRDLSDEEFLARVQMVLDQDVDPTTRWLLLRELRDLYDQRARFFHVLWDVLAARLETEDGSFLPTRQELRALLECEAERLLEAKGHQD
jgi:hypothetical protein